MTKLYKPETGAKGAEKWARPGRQPRLTPATAWGPPAQAVGPNAVPGNTLGCGPGGAYFPAPYTLFPFSNIYSINDSGRAHYNGLQIKAETKIGRAHV